MDIIKQDMTDIWAVAGDVVAPESAKVRAGWAVEAVPRQWWNWFENRQDTNIAYMLQKGIPEWDQFTEYLTNKSYVQRNNIIYKCILTSTNQDPTTATTYWVKAFTESTAYLEKIKGLPATPGRFPYIDYAGTPQLAPYGTVGLASLFADTQAQARAAIDAQQSNSNLLALSGVTPNVNVLPYFSSTTAMSGTTLTAFARNLLDDVDAATGRATLGVYSTTDSDSNLAGGLATRQPLATNLTNLAALTITPNTVAFYNGASALGLTPVTTYGRGFMNLADALASRTYIGADDASNLTTGTIPLARIPTNLTGVNAATATALQTSRTIQGVAFNGTANITLSVVDKDSATGAAILPAGNTAARPASPVNGMFRYNQDLNVFEGYQAGVWAGVAGSAGGKNRIINGDCRVAQRGTSVTVVAGSAYGGPDRYIGINNGTTGGTFTQNYTTFSNAGVTYPCISHNTVTAPTNLVSGNFFGGITQVIEGYNCFDLLGSPVTVSFLFVANVSGTFSVALRDGTGSRSYVSTFTHSAGNVTPVTVSIPAIPLSATVPNSASAGLILSIGGLSFGTYQAPSLNAWNTGNYVGASTNTIWATGTNYIAATNIQLEAGTVATPFERLNITTQIAQCQRYYRNQGVNYTMYQTSGNGFGVQCPHPVIMRTTPTVVFTPITVSNVTGVGIGADTTTFNQGGYATGTGTVVVTGNATFSAEL